MNLPVICINYSVNIYDLAFYMYNHCNDDSYVLAWCIYIYIYTL